MRAADEILARVYSRILDEQAGGYDDWLYAYCGHVATPAGTARYLRYLDDLLAFARVRLEGADVVDAGCGFGFTLLAATAYGASSARGVDTTASMIRTIEAYRPLLPPELAARLQVEVGDVSALPYEDESVDVVLSIEAISHYRDVAAFLAEAGRVLRPGGALVISDGNNGRNPKTRRETVDVWGAFEEGTAATIAPHAADLQPYRLRRRDWIAEHAPDLDADDLARRTFGLDFAQLAAVCEQVRAGGEPAWSYYDGTTVPVNPEDGSVIERLFDPYELAGELRDAGFTTRVRGYWGGAGGRSAVRAADRVLGLLSRITIRTARAFRIAARKR